MLTHRPETGRLTSSVNRLTFDFSLIGDDGWLRDPNQEEMEEIIAVFPGCSGLGTQDPYFVVTFPGENDLPPRPWPICLAGAPLLISCKSMIESPVDIGHMGQTGKPMFIQSSLKRWKEPSLNALDEIVQEYKRLYDLEVDRIDWYGGRMEIVPRPSPQYDLTKLPPFIDNFGPINKNRILVTYKVDSGSKIEAARRTKKPSLEISDNTDYGSQLRPGVMIGSGRDSAGDELLTTAGIPVQGPDGARYITVASHGFPQPQAVVYHPDGDGKRIGQVERGLAGTDISLVKLDDGLDFSCETFGQGLNGRLTGMKAHREISRYDLIYFDSPISGFSEAVVLAKTYSKILVDEEGPKNHWIHGNIVHTGTGGLRVQAGTCGSVIWNDEGEAVGFYRYEEPPSKAHIVSVQALLDLGFSLTPIAAGRGDDQGLGDRSKLDGRQ